MSPSYKITLTLFHEMFASHADQIRQLQSCIATAQASAGQLLEEMEGDRSRLIDLLQAAHLPTIAASIEAALPVQELPVETTPLSLEPVPVAAEPESPDTDDIRALKEDGAETALALSGLGIIDYTDLAAPSAEHWARIEILLDGDDGTGQETCVGQLVLFSEDVPTACVDDAQREIFGAVVAAIAKTNESVSEEMATVDAFGAADLVETRNTTDHEASPTDASETATDDSALAAPAEIAVRTPNDLLIPGRANNSDKRLGRNNSAGELNAGPNGQAGGAATCRRPSCLSHPPPGTCSCGAACHCNGCRTPADRLRFDGGVRPIAVRVRAAVLGVCRPYSASRAAGPQLLAQQREWHRVDAWRSRHDNRARRGTPSIRRTRTARLAAL